MSTLPPVKEGGNTQPLCLRINTRRFGRGWAYADVPFSTPAKAMCLSWEGWGVSVVPAIVTVVGDWLYLPVRFFPSHSKFFPLSSQVSVNLNKF